MIKQFIHTLYIPGQKPRSFLTLQLAYAAAEHSGSRCWTISRLVIMIGALLLVSGPVRAAERDDQPAKVADTYQPRQPRLRAPETVRCVTTLEPGKEPVTRCGL